MWEKVPTWHQRYVGGVDAFTPSWLNPAIQLFTGEPYNCFAIDLWSLGISTFVMLSGFPLWDKAVAELCPACTSRSSAFLPCPLPADCFLISSVAIATEGRLRELLIHWEFDRRVSPEALNLICGMLVVDPAHRLQLDALLGHAWLH